jgi:hypothetical protein
MYILLYSGGAATRFEITTFPTPSRLGRPPDGDCVARARIISLSFPHMPSSLGVPGRREGDGSGLGQLG